jgi:hypothetical protein
MSSLLFAPGCQEFASASSRALSTTAPPGQRGSLQTASALPFAAPLNRLSRWIEPPVSDKGGMFVKLDGIGHDGDRKSITWHLIAAENHGPHIPCGASIALTQKLARGQSLPSGAMPCQGLLTVEEYLAPLKGLNIREIAA